MPTSSKQADGARSMLKLLKLAKTWTLPNNPPTWPQWLSLSNHRSGVWSRVSRLRPSSPYAGPDQWERCPRDADQWQPWAECSSLIPLNWETFRSFYCDSWDLRQQTGRHETAGEGRGTDTGAGGGNLSSAGCLELQWNFVNSPLISE